MSGRGAASPSPSTSRESSPLSSAPGSESAEMRDDGEGEQQSDTHRTPTPYAGEKGEQGAGSLQNQERTLVEKYGSLYAADMEKERRKFTLRAQFNSFQDQMEDHKRKAEYLTTRNKVWTEGREQREAEIEKCRMKVEELEAELETNQTAQDDFNERLEGDALAFETDKATSKKYNAYFSLESDELDV